MQYGCLFVGYEINGDFCKLCRKRLVGLVRTVMSLFFLLGNPRNILLERFLD